MRSKTSVRTACNSASGESTAIAFQPWPFSRSRKASSTSAWSSLISTRKGLVWSSANPEISVLDMHITKLRAARFVPPASATCSRLRRPELSVFGTACSALGRTAPPCGRWHGISSMCGQVEGPKAEQCSGRLEALFKGNRLAVVFPDPYRFPEPSLPATANIVLTPENGCAKRNGRYSLESLWGVRGGVCARPAHEMGRRHARLVFRHLSRDPRLLRHCTLAESRRGLWHLQRLHFRVADSSVGGGLDRRGINRERDALERAAAGPALAGRAGADSGRR